MRAHTHTQNSHVIVHSSKAFSVLADTGKHNNSYNKGNPAVWLEPGETGCHHHLTWLRWQKAGMSGWSQESNSAALIRTQTSQAVGRTPAAQMTKCLKRTCPSLSYMVVWSSWDDGFCLLVFSQSNLSNLSSALNYFPERPKWLNNFDLLAWHSLN